MRNESPFEKFIKRDGEDVRAVRLTADNVESVGAWIERDLYESRPDDSPDSAVVYSKAHNHFLIIYGDYIVRANIGDYIVRCGDRDYFDVGAHEFEPDVRYPTASDRLAEVKKIAEKAQDHVAKAYRSSWYDAVDNFSNVVEQYVMTVPPKLVVSLIDEVLASRKGA